MAETRTQLQTRLARLKQQRKILKLKQKRAEIVKAQEVAKIADKGIAEKTLEVAGEFAKDILLDAPEIAGSIGGTILGAPFAAVPGGQAAAPFLSAAGQAGGEAIKQVGQQILRFAGVDELPGGIPVNAPVDAAESRRRLAGEFGSGLLFGGAARVAKPVGKLGLKTGKKIGSKLSGVPEQAFEDLFARPGAALSAGKKKAGELFGKLTAKVRALGPEISEEGAEKSVRVLAKEARKLFDSLPANTPAREKAGFALKARQLLDQRLRKEPKGFQNTDAGRKLLQIRERLDKAAKLDPDIRKADKIFRESKIAEPFRNILPITKGGGTGLLRTLAGGAVSSANPLVGSLFSPAVQGALTLGAKGVSKAAEPLLNRPGLIANLVRAAQAVGNRDPNKGPGTSLVDTLTK